MKKSPLIYLLLLSAFLLIGAGCQNQKSGIPLPPADTQAVLEKQDSVSKMSLPGGKPNTNSVSVPIDKDFLIINVGNSNIIGRVVSIFPMVAEGCDIYEFKDGVPLYYSKIDFFISKDGENAPAILIGTAPPGSGGGSGECSPDDDEDRLKSKLEPGKYRIWAVRYIDNKPDKRTPDFFVTLK